MHGDSGTGRRRSTTLNRRQLLQAVGVGAASLTALSGIASVHQSQFFGCSQVCTDTEGNYAVVFHRGEYECRPIERTSERNNLTWDWDAYCYEADWDEAVVGMIEENVLVGGEIVDDGTCTLCLNPNRCAENYVDDPSDVVDALDEDDTCAPCLGSVELGTDCEVYGSSGRDAEKSPPTENPARRDPNGERDSHSDGGKDERGWDRPEDEDRRNGDSGDGRKDRGRGTVTAAREDEREATAAIMAVGRGVDSSSRSYSNRASSS